MKHKKIRYHWLIVLAVLGLVWQTVTAAPSQQGVPTYEIILPLIFKPEPTPTPTRTPTRTPTTAVTVLPPGTPPNYYTTSWYMTPQNINNTHQMGCQAGQQTVQLPGTQDSLILLAFGQPWGDSTGMGTLLLRQSSYHVTTISTITTAVQNFMNGYMACYDGSSTVDIGVGTSNFAFLTSWEQPWCPENTNRWMCSRENAYAHGRAWAIMARNLNTWAGQRGYASRITVAGASDLELSWNYPVATIDWVKGFDDNDNNSVLMYNFGACEGCPTRQNPNTNPNLVHGWSMNNVHWIAWRAAPVWPIPEIYLNSGTNARQWAYLSYWGVTQHNYSKIVYLSALTQLQACGGINTSACMTTDNTPQQAWRQLYDEVNFWPQTALATIPWMTDIDWP